MRLHPATSALVLIDLQRGVTSRQLEPRSAAEVIADAKTLAARFRAAASPVVNVRVSWHADLGDIPPARVDAPIVFPDGGPPEGFDAFVDGIMQPGDLEIVKRQWGAFYATELDMQLRRRGIGTLVIGGIATNFGVESTVRDAWERGYEVVVAEDLCATRSHALHDMAITSIFPRISRLTTATAIRLGTDS